MINKCTELYKKMNKCVIEPGSIRCNSMKMKKWKRIEQRSIHISGVAG